MASYCKTNKNIAMVAISIEKPFIKNRKKPLSYDMKDHFIGGDIFYRKYKNK